ncbi:MAG: CopG family transcriptional regulator [Candidatus Altiarchaeales archaeon]|nr:MAG: CopG family transcriptional regulator [Candidatus Altiarchaeales archaeon]
MKTTIVSVRIPTQLKKDAEKYGIDIKEVLLESLENRLKEEKFKRLKDRLKKVAKILQKIPEDELTSIVRESRDER